MSTDRTDHCTACGQPGGPGNPLCPDGINDEVSFHVACYNGPAAQAWRATQRETNPAYARSLQLRTVRAPTTCPQCGAELNISPQVWGMGSSFAAHCTRCHRRGPDRLSAYGRTGAAYQEMVAVEDDFLRSRGLDRIESRMLDIAAAYDHFVNGSPCACGGTFSLAAKPRCPLCDAVVIDSCFNIVDLPVVNMRRPGKERGGAP